MSRISVAWGWAFFAISLVLVVLEKVILNKDGPTTGFSILVLVGAMLLLGSYVVATRCLFHASYSQADRAHAVLILNAASLLLVLWYVGAISLLYSEASAGPMASGQENAPWDSSIPRGPYLNGKSGQGR